VRAGLHLLLLLLILAPILGWGLPVWAQVVAREPDPKPYKDVLREAAQEYVRAVTATSLGTGAQTKDAKLAIEDLQDTAALATETTLKNRPSEFAARTTSASLGARPLQEFADTRTGTLTSGVLGPPLDGLGPLETEQAMIALYLDQYCDPSGSMAAICRQGCRGKPEECNRIINWIYAMQPGAMDYDVAAQIAFLMANPPELFPDKPPALMSPTERKAYYSQLAAQTLATKAVARALARNIPLEGAQGCSHSAAALTQEMGVKPEMATMIVGEKCSLAGLEEGLHLGTISNPVAFSEQAGEPKRNLEAATLLVLADTAATEGKTLKSERHQDRMWGQVLALAAEREQARLAAEAYNITASQAAATPPLAQAVGE
jgi:hypothetical protein